MAGKVNIALDLRGFEPNLLERAVSIEIARSLLPTTDPNVPISIAMAISNAFISGIAYGRKDFTPAEIEELKKNLAEGMNRIEMADKEEREHES